MKTTTMIASIVATVCLASASCSDPQSALPVSSEYPTAVAPERVGSYPALAKSGGGYFYDEVLEYRVWVHPDGDDYYRAFPTYEQAFAFAEQQRGAEEPLVLVRQREYINEPQPGVFQRVKNERITEWQVHWLEGTKLDADSIRRFLESKGSNAAQKGE
jgi:hypothetical protein